MKKPTCKDCPYWLPWLQNIGPSGDKNAGCCQRLPPSMKRGTVMLWPRTESWEFCGKHPNFALWVRLNSKRMHLKNSPFGEDTFYHFEEKAEDEKTDV